MTHLLIDGDLLLYRAASACETEVDWGDGLWVLHGNLTEAINLVEQSIASITTSLGGTSITLCLSDRSNFRKTLTDTYKAGRKGTRKPVVYGNLFNWSVENLKPVIKPTLEADDTIGLLATHPDFKGIVVSEDKDMQTLACTLYKGGQLTTITPEMADRFWMIQTLTGDATDGYKGVTGVGPKTAEKLLTGKTLRENWPHVVSAYRRVKMTEEDALLSARLARILRHGDYNEETQEVRLWSPSMIT